MSIRSIIKRIIRDKLSFLLLYFGSGLILFAFAKSLSISKRLDDLANYDERYQYNKQLIVYVMWNEQPQNDAEAEQLYNEILSIEEYAFDKIKTIDSEETAVVYSCMLDNLFYSNDIYIAVSDNIETKYLKKYADYEKSDVFITKSVLPATYKIDDKTYIDISGKRFKVGGEYTYNGVGNNGRVVIPWTRLSDDDKHEVEEIFLHDSLFSIVGVSIKNIDNIDARVSEIIDQISEYDYNGKYSIEGYIDSYSIDEKKYNDFNKTNKSNMSNMLIFSILNYVVILIMWIRRRERETSIRRIWGQSTWRIAAEQLKSILACVVLSIPFMFIYDMIYSVFLFNENMNKINYTIIINLMKYVFLLLSVVYLILIVGVHMANTRVYIREE